MKDRFIVELYDEDEVLQSSTIYKTYRDIAKGTGEAYYECRNIHLIGNGTILENLCTLP